VIFMHPHLSKKKAGALKDPGPTILRYHQPLSFTPAT
jgi:hypothetical protein